jgi:hypothetical protein
MISPQSSASACYPSGFHCPDQFSQLAVAGEVHFVRTLNRWVREVAVSRNTPEGAETTYELVELSPGNAAEENPCQS